MEQPQGSSAIATAVNDSLESEFEAPHAGPEQAIAEVWCKIFGRSRIGRNDNFFEMGGNSLMGMDLTELLAERLHVNVSVVTLFQHPSIREMAEALEEIRDSGY